MQEGTYYTLITFADAQSAWQPVYGLRVNGNGVGDVARLAGGEMARFATPDDAVRWVSKLDTHGAHYGAYPIFIELGCVSPGLDGGKVRHATKNAG